MKKTKVLVGFLKMHYFILFYFFCLRFIMLLINGQRKVQKKIPNPSGGVKPLTWTLLTDILAEMI